MPHVNIRITRDGAGAGHKAESIRGSTERLARVLNKYPATTNVIVDEVDTDNWGVGAQSVTGLRKQGGAQGSSAGWTPKAGA
jgi:4-oxalocrotonate tautomerase